MIRVYYGSSDYETERFMYETIAAQMPADTIVIVPDQFTLQAEEDALKYMRADVLMNLEIMSRTGFTRRVLGSTGSPEGILVNRYGRYMLLLSIIRGIEAGREGVFGEILRTGRTGRSALAHMISEEISELKQYGISPEDLLQIADQSEEGLLSGKLRQTAELYRSYQEMIQHRFSDSDDLQSEVASRVHDFQRADGCSFWIYGFEYMSPDMMELVCAISRAASQVSIVLTGERTGEEEFDLFQRMTGMLRQKCQEHADQYEEHHVPESFLKKKNPSIHLVRAGSFYDEAETVASEIMELVRDQGFRFREIAVICNDLEVRGSVFSRVFEQYGIPLFMDRKRAVTQEPAVEFLSALMDCVSGKMQFDDVFRMLKTGFSPLTDQECDRLERYGSRYHIKSGRWKKDFRYGLTEEGKEGLAEINQLRETVYQFIHRFEQMFHGQKTVREKTAAVYTFLTEVVHMPEQLDQSVLDMEEKSLFASAASASQVWKIIVEMMDQMVEVVGDLEMPPEDYSEILKEGFREVEIGIIPSTADQVLLGNMRRTRLGTVRALFVAGANDGVLPEEAADQGLFSDLEKEEMARIFRKPVGRTGVVQGMEQDLAIYRNLGRAEQRLTLSYSSQDTNGAELRPSILVRRFLQRYGREIEEKSVQESGEGLRLIQTRKGLMPHMAEVFRKASDDDCVPGDEWKAAALVVSDSPSFANLKKGLFFTRRTERLDRDHIRRLYGKGKGGVLTLSPSRIEKFIRCPFSYFVQYGLKPSENRSFDVDSRSVGDVFHYCMKMTAASLTEAGVPVSDPASRWMTVTREELREMILQFTDDFSESYRDGVFGYSARERYLRERLEDVIFLNAAVMVEQVRKGRIRSVYFEKEFGRNRKNAFPPVRLELADGDVVYLEGIIDRVDEFRGDAEHPASYIRIVDYKTGGDRFRQEEVTAGIRLQLVIYLKSALGGIENSLPAGVFYFPAGEKTRDVSAEQAGEAGDIYVSASRMDGVLVKEDHVIEGMDAEISMNEESTVIPVRRSGNGYVNLRSSGRVMEREDFDRMIRDAEAVLQEAAEKLAGGSAEIDPKRAGSFEACRYCGYDSICHRKVTGGTSL